MEITEIKVRRLFEEGKMLALVSIVVDDCLAVHDIKVIDGPERIFVAMPSRRENDGAFRDIVHPLNGETRQQMESSILAAYEREKERESHEYMEERKPEDDL